MDARAYTPRARAYMPLDPTGRRAVAGRMHFGVVMFPTDYAMRVDDLARAVEARGFESLWFPEHTHIPVSRRSPWPGGPTLPKEYWRTPDLFVAPAAATARARSRAWSTTATAGSRSACAPATSRPG